MKKITLFLVGIAASFTTYAQTISLANITSASVTVDANDKPTAIAPNTPFAIELSGFPEGPVQIFNQINNASGEQFAGGGVTITVDASGNGMGTLNPGFFPADDGEFTMDQNITWNAEIGGGATSNSITIPALYDNPTLSTAELIALEEATLSPNPTNGIVNVIGNNASYTSVEVYNTLGSLVGNSTDLSGLASGVYFIKIYTNDGSVTKKLIKN